MLLSLGPGIGTAVARKGSPPLPAPSARCHVTDERLSELSGLAAEGESWYAVTDGGSVLKVYVLDPGNCSVRDVRTAGIDPYDVEDLALAANGDLWLADTGDNSLRRETVALHVMSAGGSATLYRLTWPDGPHNAEALILGPEGVPHIITKEPFGPAGIYRPAAELTTASTTPLEKVGSLAVEATRTPGGPLPGTLGSVVVTGAAVSHDGTVVAVRTYTDAYLYSAPGGDVLAALQEEPLRVPLPHEPQGEALAFEPDGTILSASEGSRPVRAIPGVVQAMRTYGASIDSSTAPTGTTSHAENRDNTPEGMRSAGDDRFGLSTTKTALLVGATAAVIIVFAGRLRRRSR
ncbi:esterase-like activity of phytase family protein [Halopolyspora algeriensis]|uniref:esterase-like activity of phytase family protein n=1 Tax=Halopolyspora algeriensis TaxID=1500506 RepID=UPI001FE61A6F|nr:esterase-like activity of phytase family protein [Halopolyspora algeriensis]